MGDSIRKAATLLKQARDLLLSESQFAAGQGQWDMAKELMEQAEAADRLQSKVAGERLDDSAVAESSNGRAAVAELMPKRESSAPADQYPKYFVRDGSLVKQGRQRQGNDIYEHLVPQDRYETILDRLKQLSERQRNRQFAIDQIQKELDCPRYMTYVVVSMLLRQGLLNRARKGRYTFAAPESFTDQVETVWDKLMEENAL